MTINLRELEGNQYEKSRESLIDDKSINDQDDEEVDNVGNLDDEQDEQDRKRFSDLLKM